MVQRYGLEVNGGAELLCRLHAEHLTRQYNSIEVLTTKAIDYITWRDEYECDTETINGVTVRRFSVRKERKMERFSRINQRFVNGRLHRWREKKWVEEQGPFVPDLIQYIKKNRAKYDVYIFHTYLYYPTVMGVPIVPDKAIVVPDAHDEPFLKMNIFKPVFLEPRAFFFNTFEEAEFVSQRFPNSDRVFKIGGVGVDLPEQVNAKSFKDKYGIDDYIVYVGRIDQGKNCHLLFRYFMKFKKDNDSGLKLVLMGKPVMEVPEHKDIISLGFVEDQEKFDGIAGAKALILPSEFESLSMVVLEAMKLKVPVIVNGKCDVLRGHCVKSNGALYYYSYKELEAELRFVLKNKDIVERMCENAYQYVTENYQWDAIIERLTELIELV